MLQTRIVNKHLLFAGNGQKIQVKDFSTTAAAVLGIKYIPGIMFLRNRGTYGSH